MRLRAEYMSRVEQWGFCYFNGYSSCVVIADAVGGLTQGDT
jgi:hypothetical protein